MSRFIISWLCYSERKYLLRSRLLKATVSRIRWRKARETSTQEACQPQSHSVIKDNQWRSTLTKHNGVAVPDYIADHTHVAFRTQYGSWGAKCLLGCNKAGLGSPWTMNGSLNLSIEPDKSGNQHPNSNRFVQMERESIQLISGV